jgi:hypothetical protein
VRTDECERLVLDAFGDDRDELLEHLDLWSEAIIDAGSYPQRIKGCYYTGGRPRFGSGLTLDTAAELSGDLIDHLAKHHDATPDASVEESARWYSARRRCSSSFLGNAKNTSVAPSPTATMPAI